MSSQWFYTRDGKSKVGPFSSAQFHALANAGELHPTDMVLKLGTSKWVLADQIEGLFSAAAGPVKPNEQPVAAPIPVNNGEVQSPRPLDEQRHEVVKCPGCKKSLKIPYGKTGAKLRCPVCKTTFSIPSVTPKSDGEDVLTDLLNELFSRTHGRFTKEGAIAANVLCRRLRIPSKRARQIAGEVRERWQKATSPASGHLALAKDHLEKNAFDLAIADATEAIRFNPESADAYSTRAAAYRSKDDFERAIADA